MDEADFWASLEYRVCRELAGMQNWDLRHLWCDGFMPERYHLGAPEPRITGTAWSGHGQRQEEWELTLFLPHAARAREEIDWPSLMPSEKMTRWLALDQGARRLQIEPAAAIPDPA